MSNFTIISLFLGITLSLYFGFVFSTSIFRSNNYDENSLLFFNRVPKVGSQMMMSLLYKLSSRNNFGYYPEGGRKFLEMRPTFERQVNYFKIIH